VTGVPEQIVHHLRGRREVTGELVEEREKLVVARE